MEVQNSSFTDDTILHALQAGGRQSDDAIRHLYQGNYHYLRSFVLNNSGSEDDAADMFQETIIAFVNLVAAGKFRGASSIRTFLFALNRNLWLNELKRRGRAAARADVFAQRREEEATLQQGLEYQQSASALAQLMEQLGAHCKQILLQFYFENRSMKEIVAGLPYENEQVVRNKKSKCLKQLAGLVQGKPIYEQLKTLLHG